jgi:UDP:flavonoid glycosyltransferase YjiC (YdhE family)
VAGIPYFTITNAYWGKYSQLPFPLPEHPMTRVFGVRLSQALFNLARPVVFAVHARPLNRVRREYGLPSLGADLPTVYTDADQTLYADIPEFIPTTPLPPHHHWLGPVLWSPAMELPEWWETLPSDRPIIYVALGSSGENVRALPIILQGLAELPVTVIATTAGQPLKMELPANAYVADFLPGMAAAARSQLVICNGGSLATQQALAAGAPVLGIASNMDQHLNMLCLERAGVGRRLRVGRLTAEQVRTAAQRWLEDTGGRLAASRLRQVIRSWDTARVFVEKLVLDLRKT